MENTLSQSNQNMSEQPIGTVPQETVHQSAPHQDSKTTKVLLGIVGVLVFILVLFVFIIVRQRTFEKNAMQEIEQYTDEAVAKLTNSPSPVISQAQTLDEELKSIGNELDQEKTSEESFKEVDSELETL